jgi:nitrate/nitrite-specific signal transduction histidine kinase
MSEKHSRDVEEVFPEAEEVVKVFTKAKRFTSDLLKENERLRYKVLDMKQQLALAKAGRGEGTVDVAEENRTLKKELEQIKESFEKLNKENQEFQERYLEIEKQNENLLNLYVSGYQLHTTLSEESVQTVIQEILLNLLGAEVFSIWVVNQQTGKLDQTIWVDENGAFGSEGPDLPGELVAKMAQGESVFEEPGSPGRPLVCIPLQLDGQTMGVLAIYKLLQQKEGITNLDQELLGLLTSQSAAALIGSMVVCRVLPKLRWLSGGTVGS